MSTRVPQETDLSRFYALFPQPSLAKDLFNIVEGHRVDARMRRAYPGIRRDMDMVQEVAAARRPELGGLVDSQAVVEALLQHTLGMDPDVSEVAPATREVVERARTTLTEVEAEDVGVDASAEVTARLYRLIDEGLVDPGSRNLEDVFGEQPPPEEGDAPPPEDTDAPSPMDAEGGGGADDYESPELPPFMTPVMEELMKQQPELFEKDENQPPPDPLAEYGADQDDEGGEAEQADDAMSTSEMQAGDEGTQDEMAQAGETSELEEAPPGTNPDSRADDAEGGSDSPIQSDLAAIPQAEDEKSDDDLGEETFLYDEWDHKIEDYRPNWCTLREQRATRSQEGFVASTFHEYGGIVTQIRRNFQLMRPERLKKMRYQVDGDDLDTDGLVEYVVDRRARIAPSGRVYIKRDKTERDVTTAFLVDMSSSTDRKIDGRKRIIDIEKEGLLLMCEALEAIRDEYAIYGFSGNGREDSEFYIVKDLGERYDDRVKGKIGGIYARQKTRMGPAIRHATRQLVAADSAIKLMILLTDGKPYDSDTYQDNTYAQEDTKIALREARREKIHLFCVTVDSEAADYLPNMYSDANFVIIDDVRTLPQKLPQLYRRLTT